MNNNKDPNNEILKDSFRTPFQRAQIITQKQIQFLKEKEKLNLNDENQILNLSKEIFKDIPEKKCDIIQAQNISQDVLKIKQTDKKLAQFFIQKGLQNHKKYKSQIIKSQDSQDKCSETENRKRSSIQSVIVQSENQQFKQDIYNSMDFQCKSEDYNDVQQNNEIKDYDEINDFIESNIQNNSIESTTEIKIINDVINDLNIKTQTSQQENETANSFLAQEWDKNDIIQKSTQINQIDENQDDYSIINKAQIIQEDSEITNYGDLDQQITSQFLNLIEDQMQSSQQYIDENFNQKKIENQDNSYSQLKIRLENDQKQYIIELGNEYEIYIRQKKCESVYIQNQEINENQSQKKNNYTILSNEYKSQQINEQKIDIIGQEINFCDKIQEVQMDQRVDQELESEFEANALNDFLEDNTGREQFIDQTSEIKTIFDAISDPKIDIIRSNQQNETNRSFLINEWNKNDIIQDNQKYFDVIKSENELIIENSYSALNQAQIIEQSLNFENKKNESDTIAAQILNLNDQQFEDINQNLQSDLLNLIKDDISIEQAIISSNNNKETFTDINNLQNSYLDIKGCQQNNQKSYNHELDDSEKEQLEEKKSKKSHLIDSIVSLSIGLIGYGVLLKYNKKKYAQNLLGLIPGVIYGIYSITK